MTDYILTIKRVFDRARDEARHGIEKSHSEDPLLERVKDNVSKKLDEKESVVVDRAKKKAEEKKGDLNSDEIAEIIRDVMKEYSEKDNTAEVIDAIIGGVNWLEGKSEIKSTWSASITLMCLLDVREPPNILKLNMVKPSECPNIKACETYIINSQRTDCGWSSSRYDESNSNIFDSSLAVLSLLHLKDLRKRLEPGYEDSQLEEAIDKGINFIKNSRHNLYQGWPPTPDKEIDVGATSLAIRALLKAGVDRRSNDIKDPLKWIKDNQLPDGGWGAVFKKAPGNVSLIARTYDAIAALIEAGEDPKSKIIQKSVEWVSDLQKLVEKDGKWGWGWGREAFKDSTIYISDVENTALAIMILLYGEKEPDSKEVEVGINWLLKRKEADSSCTRWINKEQTNDDETPRVIICLNQYSRSIKRKVGGTKMGWPAIH